MGYEERKVRYDPKAPPQLPVRKVSERRVDLWNALAKFIHDQGAAVTSLPFHSPMVVEIAKDSDLPMKLTEFGYQPQHSGSLTRITSSAGIVPADVIKVALPP